MAPTVTKKSETFSIRQNPKNLLRDKKAIFSFFAGAGFLDLGFENSGYEVAYVNEYYGPFLKAYKHSRATLGITEPKYGYYDRDIKNLLSGKDKKGLTEAVQNARKDFGVIGFIGGPPCPDFSVGGKNKGKDGENGILTKIYTDLIVQQKPDFFLFENVKGLWSTKRHREFYEQQKKKLKRAGYVLTDRLINAVEYGAAQDRNRIILIGFHKNFLKDSKVSDLSEVFPWNEQRQFDRSVAMNQEWPETNGFKENSKAKAPKGIITELTVSYWFEKNDVENHPNADDYFQPRAALSRFQTIPEGDVSKKSFKRLHRWRYSPTAAYGNNEVHIHPFKARRISVAEAMAIQSLPKNFVFPKEMTLSDKFKAVGNGVPYVAAKGVASAINKFLNQVL